MDKYEAENALAQYKQRRLKCAPVGKQCQEWIEIIEEKLVQTWSPEQIANTVLKGKLSFKTIYRWLYQGILMLTDHRVLRHKGKRQKPRETRGRFNVGTSISKRPQDVKKRESFENWIVWFLDTEKARHGHLYARPNLRFNGIGHTNPVQSATRRSISDGHR